MDWQAERVKTLPPSGIRKIMHAANRLEAEGKKVVHLEIGRPDFDTPVHIKEAAKKALDEGKIAYTSNWGIIELRRAIAAKMARDNDLRADPETDIIVTNGAIEAIFIAMMATLDPGDEVLIPEPGWPMYRHCARLAQATPVVVPLREDDGYRIDPDEVRARVTPRTRMLVLNTPHNPCGIVVDRDTIEALASIAIEHGLLVLADEIYEKLIYDGQHHHSIASLPGMWERTLTINGFSKAYAMTGWRLGYLVAPAKLIDAAVRVRQYVTTCTNTFAQYGAIAALEGSQAPVEEMVADFDRRRRLILGRLPSLPGLGKTPAQGTFYLFPSIRVPGFTSEEFAAYLLNHAHVATVPGSVFGPKGEGSIRIAYSTSYEDIAEGLDRIERTIGELLA